MAEVSLSAAEAALENQRLGALQIRVAALCTLVQICDGYDIGSIGIACQFPAYQSRAHARD